MLNEDDLTKKVFISVVSHGHGGLISSIGCLSKLSNVFTVVVKNNCPDENLKTSSEEESFILLDEAYYRGFGFNNNYVYNYCVSNLGMKENDYFIVLNPDVDVSIESIECLIRSMKHDGSYVATINLFKEHSLTVYDNSIRRFPSLCDFFMSFVFGRNKTIIDKSLITTPEKIDWCAGSFIAIKSSSFRCVSGFDVNYFMYCEDIDLCLRLRWAGFDVVYYPSIKGVHFAQHDNRSVFSKHFIWHLKSIVRYLFVKRGVLTAKSNLV